MFRLENMLMIGSTGANVGKTELATAVIKKLGKSRDVVGMKATTIRAKDGQCPRGGRGCGVCSSIDGNFCITEETDRDSGKDTSRLLAAGAARVFWLRVLKDHLEEGFKALLDIVGPDAISICESNSLRAVVEPGVFLIVRNRKMKVWKSTADEVRRYADGIVVCGEGRSDFDFDRIKLIGDKWILQEKATAIIMAGGASSRMGVDKSMLMIQGRPMIERISEKLSGTFSQVLISSNETDKYKHLGFEIVPDRVSGEGPLMGIASGLQASDNELNFVVACDIPNIDIRFVRRMLAEAYGFDIVVPITDDGKYEPLFSVYCKSAYDVINGALSSGKRKISDVFGLCRVKKIEIDAKQLVNLNTMAEYEEFKDSCQATACLPSQGCET